MVEQLWNTYYAMKYKQQCYLYRHRKTGQNAKIRKWLLLALGFSLIGAAYFLQGASPSVTALLAVLIAAVQYAQSSAAESGMLRVKHSLESLNAGMARMMDALSRNWREITVKLDKGEMPDNASIAAGIESCEAEYSRLLALHSPGLIADKKCEEYAEEHAARYFLKYGGGKP